MEETLFPSAFQILSGVMLEVFNEDFPEFFPAEVQVIWTKLMSAVYWHVTGAYTEVGWLQVSSSAVWSERGGEAEQVLRGPIRKKRNVCSE